MPMPPFMIHVLLFFISILVGPSRPSDKAELPCRSSRKLHRRTHENILASHPRHVYQWSGGATHHTKYSGSGFEQSQLCRKMRHASSTFFDHPNAFQTTHLRIHVSIPSISISHLLTSLPLGTLFVHSMPAQSPRKDCHPYLHTTSKSPTTPIPEPTNTPDLLSLQATSHPRLHRLRMLVPSTT